MQESFDLVLFAVVAVSAVAAAFTLVGSSKTYGQIGRGTLSLNEDLEGVRRDLRPAPVVASERDAEIRQMLAARNERRSRRGEAPLDVEAELKRLTAPAIDSGLREEVRALVMARNERRMRQGKEPLEVEAEVERQLERVKAGGLG